MIGKLSIIIPVFNEEKNIEEVLQNIFSIQLPFDIKKQVIIVDDRSTDESASRIEKLLSENNADTHFIKQKVNGGKGSAIRAGLSVATGDYLIIQDADLELNPQDINKLIEVAISQKADVVYGSRFLNKQPYPVPLKTKIANRFLSLMTSLMTARKITDMETCYKLIRSALLQNIQLKENRFGFEPEITMKLLRNKNIVYREFPVSYKARSLNDGKKIGLTDGIRALICLIKYRF